MAKKRSNDEASNDSNGNQNQRSVKYVPETCTSIVPQKLRDQMKIRGITHDSLAAKALTSRGDINRALENKYIDSEVLLRIAKVLQISKEVLMPLSAHTEPAEEIYAPPPPTPPREWTLEPQVIQHFMAANGVSYCVARLKSTVMDNWFGRGKFYDLRNVIGADSEELRARLARHPTVCLLLNKDPRIARLIRVCPLAENTAWWVINDWIEGKTLEDILTSGIPISKPSIKHIGMELLLGLQSLHSVEIIFRELAPERVYVSDNLENCALTDFELAKIIQGAVSVAGGWKLISKYRAPEITSRGEFSYSWDFYSWSIIMDELIAAQCEDGVETVEQFIADADVFKLINECRDLNPGHRPTCVADVISVWSNWKFECQIMADWTI